MSSMSNVIKEIIGGYVNNIDICNLELGIVESNEPISIKIANGMVLPSSLLILPENLVREKYTVSFLGEERSLYFRDKKLKAGEQVVMIKGVGGEKYLVIDRVV